MIEYLKWQVSLGQSRVNSGVGNLYFKNTFFKKESIKIFLKIPQYFAHMNNHLRDNKRKWYLSS